VTPYMGLATYDGVPSMSLSVIVAQSVLRVLLMRYLFRIMW
jgi:hypothetical protein